MHNSSTKTSNTPAMQLFKEIIIREKKLVILFNEAFRVFYANYGNKGIFNFCVIDIVMHKSNKDVINRSSNVTIMCELIKMHLKYLCD